MPHPRDAIVPPMARRLLASIGLVLALLATGCGKDDGSSTAATVTQAGAAAVDGDGTPTSSAAKESSGSKSSADASPDPRLAVVAVVRRYQQDFVDGDGNHACTLLSAAGRRQMTTGGGGKTCAESVKRVLDQASAADMKLIKRTRAGIHVNDVIIRGERATVGIGKGDRLRLVCKDERWFVDDPSP